MDAGALVTGVLGGVGITCSVVALFVRGAQAENTLKLDLRYLPRDLAEQQFANIAGKVDAVRELLEQRLNGLPCVSGVLIDCKPPRKAEHETREAREARLRAAPDHDGR